MNQIFDFFNRLNGGQKAVVVGGFSMLLVFLISIIVYGQSTNKNLNHSYLVAKDMTQNEVMIASNELETVGVPFSLIGTGDSMSIKTSKEFINIAKIKLVSSGALKGEHKGWGYLTKAVLVKHHSKTRLSILELLKVN